MFTPLKPFKSPFVYSTLLSAMTLTGLVVSAPLSAAQSIKLAIDFSDPSVVDLAQSQNARIVSQALQPALANAHFGDFASQSRSLSLTGSGVDNTASVVADFNGDGALDLVLGAADGAVRLLLNNQTATPFDGVNAASLSSAGDEVVALAAADMDLDGDIDLVVATANRVTIQLNNESPTAPFDGVTALDVFNSDNTIKALAVFDANQDGWQDMVIGTIGVNSLLLNNAKVSGLFNPLHSVPIGSESFTTALAAGDVNHDGWVDLVVANNKAINQLFLNSADGFGAEQLIGAGLNATSDIALFDMNQDGFLDVIEATLGQGTTLYLGDGSDNPYAQGTTTALASSTAQTQHLLVTDLNQDAAPDLVLFNANQDSQYYLHNNQNAAPFDQVVPVAIQGPSLQASSGVVGDFDADGDVDIVSVYRDKAATLFPNYAFANPYSASTPQLLNAQAQARDLQTGDLNHDQNSDLVWVDAQGVVHIALHNDSATPYAQDVTLAVTDVNRVYLADINRDTHVDLVLARDGVNQILLNNGSAQPFEGVSALALGTDNANTQAIGISDFNQDAWLDLVVANQGADNLVYLHDQTATAYAQAIHLSNSAFDSRDLVVADIDTDGLMDIVVGNFDAVTQIYFNAPSANYFQGVVPAALTNQVNATQSLASLDYNHDGKMDIVEGNAGQSYVVLTNRNILPVSKSAILPLGDAQTSLDKLQVADVKANQGMEILARNQNNDLVFFETLDKAEVVTTLPSAQSAFTLLPKLGESSSALVYSANGLQALNSAVKPTVQQMVFQLDAFNSSVNPKRVLMDIDNDKRVDLLTGYANSFQYLSHIQLRAPAELTNNATLRLNTNWLYALGDVDRDGDVDLVYLDSDLILYRNNGSAKPFENVKPQLLSNTGTGLFAGGYQLDLADVNQDGWLDLVLSTSYDSSPYTRVIRVYFNQKNAELYTSAESQDLDYSISNNSPYFTLLDANQDGYLDILLDSSLGDNGQMGLILNNQTATAFDPTQELLVTDTLNQPLNIDLSERALTIQDINHDGFMDFVAADDEIIYFGTAQPNQFEPVDVDALALQAGRNISHYYWQDINQDGWLDLLAIESQRLIAYLNTQTSALFNFDQGVVLVNDDVDSVLGFADFDGEGRPDLAVSRGNYIHFYTFSDFNTDLNRLNATVQSKGIRTEGSNIDRVVLSATATTEDGCVECGLEYWVSNNAGAQFFKVNSGAAFSFPTQGEELIWKTIFKPMSARAQTHLAQIDIVSNIAPVITGQKALSIQEDSPFTLSLSDLTVQDADSAYPADFSLQILAASDDSYSVDGTQITPKADFYGELTVPVQVSDGLELSAPFNLKITVESQLDAPRIVGLKEGVSFNVSEEEPFLLTIGQLQIDDVDGVMAQQSFNLVLASTSVASAQSQGSSLFITPKNQSSDQLSIPVQLVSSNGLLLSVPFDLPVTINQANDKPIITGLTQLLTTPEEQAFAFKLSYLNIQDADSSTHSLQILEGEHYSVVGTSVIPEQDFTGTLQINVQVDDGASSNHLSDVFSAPLLVTNVNDKPVFDPNKPRLIASINEDTSISIGAADLPFSDADANDTLIVEVTSGQSFSVSADPVFIGRKIITPNANFNGTLSLNVKVFDGAQYSEEIGVTIEVLAVNDAPIVQGVKQALTVVQGKEFTLNPDLLQIDNPETDEALQIEVLAGDNYSLVEGRPNVIVPTLSAGLLAVNVVAIDEAGNRSPVKALNLTVVSNDIGPIITGQTSFPVVQEDGVLSIQLSDLVIEPAQPIGGEYQLLIQQSSNHSYEVRQNAAGETVVQFPQSGRILVDLLLLNAGEPVSFQYQVAVENVNDSPVIIRQVNKWQAAENTAVEVSIADFEVTDEDTLASDLVLVVKDGPNYTHSPKGDNLYFVIPNPGFVGVLDVKVAVSDGSQESEEFTAQMTVRDDSPSSGGGSFGFAYLVLAGLVLAWRRRNVKK